MSIIYQQSVIKRWLEQGLRATTVLHIAEDAYKPGRWKHKSAKRYKYLSALQVPKKRLLNSPYSFEVVAKVLEEHRKAISQALTIPDATHEVH